MPDPNDHDYDPPLLDAIDDSVVAYPNPPVVLFALELAYAWRQWIFG